MRKLPLLLFLTVCCCLQQPLLAQNQAFKNAIHAKLNFIDYGLLFDNNLKLGQGFEFAYFRNVAPALNVGVPLKLGLAKLPAVTEGEDGGNTVTAGADLQFRLENMKSEAKVIPFAFGGAGYMFEKNNSHVQFPFGAGLHFRLSPYAFINVQGEFRKALVDNRDNLQLGIGYVYLLHKSETPAIPPQVLQYDQDRDGTPDSLDVCPTLAGPPTALGCPDNDNDGLGDAEDDCPEEPGSIETNGCPDYDNDGFADKLDDCPTEAGPWKGCPDADFDGIPDKDDKCPNERGSEANMGCPDSPDSDGDGTPDAEDLCPDKAGANRGCPDTDGDGIADNYDECPEEAGVVERNGCPEPKDRDGDGVADEKDQCPDLAGTAKNNGCPEPKDRDGDGIADEKDKCPDEAGTKERNGCPEPKDRDGDGVPDEKDKCPDEAGTKERNGCPEPKDSDGDGVTDDKDQCPEVAGTKKNKGCPEVKDKDRDGVPDQDDPCPDKAGEMGGCPDTDRDGIADHLDKCPNIAGVPANFGCPVEKPEISEAREKLATAARAVQFESAKAILKDASYDILDEVVALMRKNPTYSLSISGFTDDVGDDEDNLKLSQDRARACYDYLIFRGIKADRIRYAGFGEARPIASNETPEGRELNRRVEFELVVE
ncbi:MAG: thrombospondin type 3 repeat-containing protein [Saprospiraceae bacterium]|nr:thrombospondin type 3 repeat-containing protein [Saprospiraceae bacterium]